VKTSMINDYRYKELIEGQIADLIEYLFESNRTFNVVSNIQAVSFEPALPKSISNNFKPLTLFAISGYTFESAYVEGDFFFFEAGFGPANFASLVKIPLFAIMQVVIDDNVVFINMIASNDKYIKELDKKRTSPKSTSVFLSNPDNKDLIDKLK